MRLMRRDHFLPPLRPTHRYDGAPSRASGAGLRLPHWFSPFHVAANVYQPWTEEPGGLQSMASHRVGHDWSDLAAAATFQFILFSFPPPHVHRSILCVCISISALEIGSSVPLFYIPHMCAHTINRGNLCVFIKNDSLQKCSQLGTPGAKLHFRRLGRETDKWLC